MKKCLAWLLAVSMIFSLFGCSPGSQSQQSPAESEAPALSASKPSQQTEPVTETTQPVYDEPMFLKVSSITFSLVGETDDIYLGLIPREAVSWESDDESVAVFQDGVLTATGVGSTTVRAVCQDQQVECSVSCLAQTQEELEALDPETLRAPKRLPPEVDLETECSYFTESAIVGDSITYFLFQWESKYDYLGEVTFLARGGVSLNGFVKRFKNIYYRGQEVFLEKAIADSGVKKVYFMLGQNDLSSKARTIVMDNWTELLSRIRELSPDVEIYLQSCIPEYARDSSVDEVNERIEQYNLTLREFARENDCHFIDLAYYVKDHFDRMPEIYSQGNYHMNEAGCLNWMKILRFYAQYELEGGELI